MNETVMLKEIKGESQNIRDCYEYNKNIIGDIANKIKDYNPTKIVLVARGTSMHVAIYAKYLLEIYYNLPVVLASPSVYTIYNADLNLRNSLVIAISQSGKGKDILRVVERANEDKALTVSITNTLNSALALEANHHLYCNTGEAISFAATKTFTTSLYLVTKLIYLLTGAENLAIDEEKLATSVSNGLLYHDNIKELVKDFEDVNDTIVLSRGITLPLAMETALKMTETSHYHVSAFPTSEFYHGPISMITNKMPIIVFAIDKVSNINQKEMLDVLKANDVYTLLITNDIKLCDSASKYIHVKEESDLYAMFTTTIIIQLFACELSVLRGNNPDFLQILDHISTI